jgi:hypothetical protein
LICQTLKSHKQYKIQSSIFQRKSRYFCDVTAIKKHLLKNGFLAINVYTLTDIYCDWAKNNQKSRTMST